jgi:NAD(P)-dependent dehydrogenase (short-subunit alcohol dehydrogenase family)
MHDAVWEPLPGGQRLKGRRIIVTGAASGMGLAIAKLFVREGATLALFDIEREGLEAAARDTGSLAIEVDIADPEAVSAAVSRADTGMGGIDGVVNAAGILRVASFADTAPSMWRRVHDVNLFGPYLVCRSALAPLRRSGKATIVNIASMGGIRVPLHMSAYGASKAGLIGLTQGMALELAPVIRANVVCPGVIKTPMTDALWKDDPDRGEERSRRSIGLGRKGTPMEVAYACLFLMSDESSFVTGSVYTINGGPAPI